MADRNKLLLVEHAGTARDALAALLADQGFEVRVAGGDEATPTARSFQPAVAIVDLGSCRPEVIAQLRGSTQVIAMTEYGRIGPAVAALRAGARDYLIKPVRSDELFIVIDKAIEHACLAREVARLRAELSHAST